MSQAFVQNVLAEFRAYEELRDKFLENQAIELMERGDGNRVEFVLIHGPRRKAGGMTCEALAKLHVNERSYDLRVDIPQEIYMERDRSKMAEAIIQRMAQVIATDLFLACMHKPI